jgi:hypothetical protein
MNMAVFWVVAPCSLVEVYRRFRGACCLHHEGSQPRIIMLFVHLSPNIFYFMMETTLSVAQTI